MQTILLKTLMAAQDRKGATAIEYGLIAAGVGVFIAGAVFGLGGELDELLSSIGTALEAPPTT